MGAEDTSTSRKRLLLVDDDPRNLTLLEARLEPLGHTLILARGGQEAIDLFDAAPPDLVLLDLAMPNVDGYAVLEHIRTRATEAHIPVVLLTAHSDRERRLRALQAGADEFLEKPLDGAILLARVRTLLALKEARDALQASRDQYNAHNQRLQQLQREQQELTQFVVHDLKSPISVITANVQLAREATDRGDTAMAADILCDLEEAAHLLRDMVAELLIVSRMESLSLPLTNEVISLDALLAPVATSYQRRAELKKINVTLPVETGCSLSGDRALLRRVLDNIVENSLRYTPPMGHVALEAVAAAEVEISISNDGPAISPAERGRIFEKFARGSSEAALPGCAGLGLYFCKRAVEAHGGSIRVEQTTMWPTRFVINLPRHP